jgi:hypothetical protein
LPVPSHFPLYSFLSTFFSFQAHFCKLKFPKATEENKDGKIRGLVEAVFFKLYDAEVVEEDGFNEWRYNDDDDAEAPGKNDCVFQISEFLKWLDEPAEEDSEEEEEDVGGIKGNLTVELKKK